MNPECPVTEALRLYQEQGNKSYTEAVCQTDHALQSAYLAEQESGEAELIAAALLHDIGHMLQKLGEDAALRGVDDKHENIAAGWLKRHFTERVAETVRLHVDAKRYLCAVRPGYFEDLSEASVRSLGLQGGPMSDAEITAFEALPHAQDAIKLREWDDRAKIVGQDTPDMAHFRPYLEQALSAPRA